MPETLNCISVASLSAWCRVDGTVNADGVTDDHAELCWDLRPEIAGERVDAWFFNPDDSSSPLRFTRTT